MSNMCDLPDDLVKEVLARVADEVVLRLKCVSKSWKAIIESPQFLHTRYGGIPQLIYEYETSSHNQFYMSEFMDRTETLMESGSKIEIRGKKHHDIHFIGSCNGVMCLMFGSSKVILLNPCTKQLVEVPLSRSRSGVLLGFGYDNVHDDYKMVKLIGESREYFREDVDVSKAMVYSLRSKSKRWRRLDFNIDGSYEVGYEFMGGNMGVFANGALHWFMALKRHKNAPKTFDNVAIDLATEKYRVLPLPAEANDLRTGEYHCFGELDGCLTLFRDRSENKFDVWMMKEYGVNDSWRKLSLLSSPTIFRLKRNLLRCNFDARRVIEPGMLTSTDYMAFRIQATDREEDDLILWYPPKRWKRVFTFTPQLCQSGSCTKLAID